MKNLKFLRENNHLTQRDIAQILNIPKTTYCYYEQGRTEPSIDTLIKIANYFDVSLDFLCGRPRPYDLPTTASKDQRETINAILNLNEINTLRALSYCAGLLASQK